MTKVIAAIDNSAAARPVLEVTSALARVLDATAEAVHVREDGDVTPRAESEGAGMLLRIVSGPVGKALGQVAYEPDVAALVMGIRRTPGGARPVGSVAKEVITSVPRPVVLVPPGCPVPYKIDCVLVPLAGDPASTAWLGTTIQLIQARDIEVIVLHVDAEDSLPAFTDQPQHETDTWAREFVARYVPFPQNAVRLELRVGEPSEEVLTVARESQADMIALGWAQDLSSQRARVVRSVLKRSSVPVLLLSVIEAEGTTLQRRPVESPARLS
jgi:nucleotide-binding universal stress UspA family protein